MGESYLRPRSRNGARPPLRGSGAFAAFGRKPRESQHLPLSPGQFNRMVDDHGPALYRIAYRLIGDRHEAEDIVQETFRSVWKSRFLYQAARGGAAGGNGERAWMISILRCRVADRWRKRRLPTVLPGDLGPDLATAGEPPFPGEYSDEMQASLRRLPAELRETLLLVVVGELTHQEAADELGVPLGTVLSRVSRARTRLREYMLAAEKNHERKQPSGASS